VLGPTKFTDLTEEEFKTVTGLVPQDDDFSEEPTEVDEQASINA
jgi:hypothetical protein